MTKQEANAKFNQLSPQEKNFVLKVLQDVYKKYLMGNITTDVPYFFWSIHKPLFEYTDVEKFLEIKDVTEFTNTSIYMISEYIINKRGTNDS